MFGFRGPFFKVFRTRTPLATKAPKSKKKVTRMSQKGHQNDTRNLKHATDIQKMSEVCFANSIQLHLIFRNSLSQNPARRNARSALNNSYIFEIIIIIWGLPFLNRRYALGLKYDSNSRKLFSRKSYENKFQYGVLCALLSLPHVGWWDGWIFGLIAVAIAIVIQSATRIPPGRVPR